MQNNATQDRGNGQQCERNVTQMSFFCICISNILYIPDSGNKA